MRHQWPIFAIRSDVFRQCCIRWNWTTKISSLASRKCFSGPGNLSNSIALWNRIRRIWEPSLPMLRNGWCVPDGSSRHSVLFVLLKVSTRTLENFLKLGTLLSVFAMGPQTKFLSMPVEIYDRNPNVFLRNVVRHGKFNFSIKFQNFLNFTPSVHLFIYCVHSSLSSVAARCQNTEVQMTSPNM